MIPTAEQLEEISRLPEGSLEKVPFAPLLFAQTVHRRTGILEFKRRQIWKKIVFEDGVPVDCRSNLAHETLGRYMVLEGKLSEDDFTAALSKSAARGAPLGEILLEQGLVDAVELFRILQANLAKKLLDVFTWKEGEFRRVEDELSAAESSLKIRVPQLVLTGVTKLATREEVDFAVAPLVGTRLALNPRPPFALDELRFNAGQSRLAEALRPGRRMGEVAEETGLPLDEIARTIYALSILGAIVPADRIPRDLLGTAPPPRPPAAATAAIPAPVSAPAAPAAPAEATPAAAAAAADGFDVVRRRNEVMQAFLSYRRQDAFDLLGLPEDAGLPEIAEKYLEIARRYAPWSFDHPELASVREKALDLFLAGARAYGELADTEQRNTLLFRRKTLREERARRPANMAIKTDLLDAEAQYEKGKALLEEGRYRDALEVLEFASDCDPQNGLYAAELAWCRFLVSEAHGDRAVRDLLETLRRDPGCGIASYYAGEILRQLGRPDEAEEHLRRAIKGMSPDRRPIESLKLLTAERKR